MGKNRSAFFGQIVVNMFETNVKKIGTHLGLALALLGRSKNQSIFFWMNPVAILAQACMKTPILNLILAVFETCAFVRGEIDGRC